MTARSRQALAGYLAGELPANVALMRLLVEAGAAGEAEALIESAIAATPEPGERGRLGELLGLARHHPDAWATVRGVMAEADHEAAEPGSWASVFDRLAAASPEAGVALYGLGSPELLANATDEVVSWLREQGLTGAGRTLLEIGCGYGRLSLALAGDFAALTGLDISAGMIAEARRRAEADPHLRFAVTDGRDLAGIASASVDLVLAADVFPYLVAAAGDLAARHVDEAGRVLRPGGALAILNWSYRGDETRDGAEVRAAFRDAGLAIACEGPRPFGLWDARAWTGRKPG